MSLRPATWLPSTSYLPEDDRLSLGALWYPSGSSTNFLSVRSGVIPRFIQAAGGPFQVVASSGMAANILAGQLILQGVVAGTQGAYIVTNDATVSVSFAAADGTNPRIDVVYVKISDASEGDASNLSQTLVVTGTPAPSPTAPSLPAVAGTYALANVLIPAGSSSVTSGNITDKRTFTTTLGSPVLCTSATRPSNPFDGQEIFETDSRIRWVWERSTSNWRPVTTALYAASGARPATGLPTGMRLVETDTGLNYQYNGSKWLRDQQDLRQSATLNATTTGMADIAGFTFSGEASGIYRADFWFVTLAPTANDLSIQWVLPTGATIEWTLEGPTSTDAGTTVNTTVWQGTSTGVGPLTVGGMASSSVATKIHALITMSTTAGTCKLQAAQAVAGGTSTVRSGYGTVKQVG